MLAINNLSVQFTGTNLFENVTFNIGDRDRIGLVGKNGAGKSTLLKILCGWQQPESGTMVIATGQEVGYLPQEMVPDTRRTVVAEAMTAFSRIDELLAQKVDFAIETTLATRSYVQLVKRAQAIGYKVHLLFFCLESPEQAIQRVAQRVEQGGHGIPEDVIRRRFKKGLNNLVHLFMPICDSVTLWDNTRGEASLVAKQTVETGKLEIIDQTMWNYLLQEI